MMKEFPTKLNPIILVLFFTPGILFSQRNTFEELDFDRPEAWAMK